LTEIKYLITASQLMRLAFMLNEPQDKPLIRQKGKDLWLRQPYAYIFQHCF